MSFASFSVKSRHSCLLLALMGGTALVVPHGAFAASAKTAWAVSRVASVSQGSYCTMAQQYDDGAVMTLARNTRGEYSLAIETAEPTFKEGQAQKVTLQPKGGSVQTYKVTPQSDRTIVIGIGKDEKLMTRLAENAALSVGLAGAPRDYTLSDFSAGQKDLSNCMAALKSGGASPAAAPVASVAAPATGTVAMPSVEGLLSAAPTPGGIDSLAAAASSVAVAPASKVAAAAAAVPVEVVAPPEIISAPSNVADLNGLKEKLSAAQAENAALRTQIASAAQSDDLQKLTAELSKAGDSAKSLQAENESLKAQLAAQSAAATKAGADAGQLAKAGQELQAVKAENETLKNQIGLYQGKVLSATADAAELAKVQAENARLKSDLALAGQTGGAAQKAMNDRIAALSSDVEAQKSANAALKSENEKLKADVANAAKLSVAATAPAAGDEGSEKLRKEVRDLRAQIETVQAEKTALQGSLSDAQKKAEATQLQASGGNWDLEQATRRYQESQREIQRLGAQLQTAQTKCSEEKKNIEYRLFDPAIADKQQIAKLNALEDELTAKDVKIRELDTALQTAKTQMKESPEKDQKIAALQQQIDSMKAETGEKIRQASATQDGVIASLRAELAQKTQLLSDAQGKVQQASATQTSLESLKADSAGKDKQIAELQTKLQQAEQAKISAGVSQDTTIASLRAELAQKTQLLADAQGKAQQASLSQSSLDELKTSLAKKESELATVQAKLQQAEQAKVTAAAAQDSTIAGLKTQLSSAQAEATQAAANTTKLNTEQTSTLAALQSQIQQGNSKIAELQKQITTLNEASLAQQKQIAQAALPVPETVSSEPIPISEPATAEPPAAKSSTKPSGDTRKAVLKTEEIPQDKIEEGIQSIAYAAPPAAKGRGFMTVANFGMLLKEAGVPVKGDVHEGESEDPQNYRTYVWKTDSLLGSAEMRKVGAEHFDELVSQYLDRAKENCAGDFAVVPSEVQVPSAAAGKAFEIACVGSGASSSASVLFTYGDGIAMAIAHEGRAEAMDLAMDARDKIAETIR